MPRLKHLILISILCVGLSSCAWSIGGHKSDPRPTLGRELIDLKTALEKGTITEAEYKETKEDLRQWAKHREGRE